MATINPARTFSKEIQEALDMYKNHVQELNDLLQTIGKMGKVWRDTVVKFQANQFGGDTELRAWIDEQGLSYEPFRSGQTTAQRVNTCLTNTMTVCLRPPINSETYLTLAMQGYSVGASPAITDLINKITPHLDTLAMQMAKMATDIERERRNSAVQLDIALRLAYSHLKEATWAEWAVDLTGLAKPFLDRAVSAVQLQKGSQSMTRSTSETASNNTNEKTSPKAEKEALEKLLKELDGLTSAEKEGTGGEKVATAAPATPSATAKTVAPASPTTPTVTTATAAAPSQTATAATPKVTPSAATVTATAAPKVVPAAPAAQATTPAAKTAAQAQPSSVPAPVKAAAAPVASKS